MDTIIDILEILGYDDPTDVPINENITLERTGYMDLTIERVRETKISVAHYHTQRGDLMRDPEIVFDFAGDEWTPVQYTQDPRIYQYNEDGLEDIDNFATRWNQNLKNQGFVTAAKQKAAEKAT